METQSSIKIILNNESFHKISQIHSKFSQIHSGNKKPNCKSYKAYELFLSNKKKSIKMIDITISSQMHFFFFKCILFTECILFFFLNVFILFSNA